jgi:hypothetical protein
MRKEHYGAISAVIVGFLVCRLLSFRVVDLLGNIGEHSRSGDAVVGAAFGAIPFVVLVIYTVLQLAGIDVEHRFWVKVVAVVGWLFAGGVMGLLPYSRFGAETNLVAKERHSAPGLLHALDFTLIIGLLVTVALLLAVLRSRSHDLPRRS